VRTYRGQLLVLASAFFFGASGVVGKLLLNSGITAFYLAQIRCAGAALILVTFVLSTHPQSLKLKRKEIPILFLYGCVGFAVVQAAYYFTIARMPVSIAITLEFTAALWITLYLRFIRREKVSKVMWVAILVALFGLVLLTQIWQGLSLSATGLLGGFVAAISCAGYYILGAKLVGTRTGSSLTGYGFIFATLFWAIVQPVWNFPFSILTQSIPLQGINNHVSLPGWSLILYIIIMGTILPYLLVIVAMKSVSATQASVIAMSEPVFSGIIAWSVLSEHLVITQLFGGVIVLLGIYLAERSKAPEVIEING
jgi:drug/metabolite transporter (DMT)-like permease